MDKLEDARVHPVVPRGGEVLMGEDSAPEELAGGVQGGLASLAAPREVGQAGVVECTYSALHV